jgi:hypothetical protein
MARTGTRKLQPNADVISKGCHTTKLLALNHMIFTYNGRKNKWIGSPQLIMNNHAMNFQNNSRVIATTDLCIADPLFVIDHCTGVTAT